MTALSNLIAKLDCPSPELPKLFTKNYIEILLKNINDDSLNAVKTVTKNYIEEKLQGYIINYKLYSYKTLKGITAEILIQPENSSVIIQYLLELTKDSVILRRIR